MALIQKSSSYGQKRFSCSRDGLKTGPTLPTAFITSEVCNGMGYICANEDETRLAPVSCLYDVYYSDSLNYVNALSARANLLRFKRNSPR